MADCVSVPLYPTLAPASIGQILNHSDAAACFLGKLDGWENMKTGLPPRMHCISYPLSPPNVVQRFEGWGAICERTWPLQGFPVRAAEELAKVIYTSGTTGLPKGVMHSFGNFAWALHHPSGESAKSAIHRVTAGFFRASLRLTAVSRVITKRRR